MVSNSTRIVLHRLGSEAAADLTVNTQSAAVAGGKPWGKNIYHRTGTHGTEIWTGAIEMAVIRADLNGAPCWEHVVRAAAKSGRA